MFYAFLSIAIAAGLMTAKELLDIYRTNELESIEFKDGYHSWLVRNEYDDDPENLLYFIRFVWKNKKRA